MANKNTNKNLGIVFGLLLLVVVLIFVFDSGESESTLRTDLVDIDTSSVDKVVIQQSKGPAGMVKLMKNQEGGWEVELSNDKTAPVPKQKINNLFNQLLSIKPKSLAARDKSKWGEFKVDSTGTLVQVYEDEEKVLDLNIGRFKFQQPRMMSTYVRLTEDINVYEVEGYLTPTFNKGINSWRDGRILKTPKEKWQSLFFDYPADSSFTMEKAEGKWQIAGTPVDSAETAKYLRNLSNLQSNAFHDNLTREELSNPARQLVIKTTDGESIEIKGFYEGKAFAVTSSQNESAVFDGKRNKLRNKIFAGKSKFMP